MTAPGVDDRLVAGRYARRAQLGRGGFGIVWRAHDTLLRRDVAMKEVRFPPILTPEEQSGLREKVLREARAAARLNHPAVVTVYDVVEEDGRPFIVMELVDAPNLAEIVHRDGPIPEQWAAEIGLEILGALTAAHAEGIIHRDVKPANVMVSATGRVQLAEFGIASIIEDPKVTSSGQLSGSPSYMAPEQAQNRPAGAATDLWGLGATLYFAVEGAPPFERDGAILTLTSVLTDEPRRIERAEHLAPLLGDLLQKSPDARPSVEETRRRLGAVAAAGAVVPDRSPTVRYDADALATAIAAASATAVDESALPADALQPEDPAASARPPSATTPQREPAPSRFGEPTGAAVPPPGAPAPVSSHESADPPPAVRRTRLALPSRSVPLTAAIVVAVLAVVVVGVLLATRDRGDTVTTAGQTPETTAEGRTDTTDGAGSSDATAPATTGAPRPTTAPSRPRTTAGPRAEGVPADWVPYQDPATGYTISRPPNWTITTDGSLTNIRDPESGAYMRVDFTTEPGPSPEQAWLDFEPRFAAENPNYRRIEITPTTFKGFDAALWEFTYTGLGTDLHAADLGFVTGTHGFALNFQSRASDWDEMQDEFEAFKASFRAPGT